MPRGDRTGPAGAGPMTGRAAGFCAGYGVPGYASAAGGRGCWGRGRGRGFGQGFGWARVGYGQPVRGGAAYGPVMPTVTAEQEIVALKQQAEFLQNDLSQVNERISQLEAESKK